MLACLLAIALPVSAVLWVLAGQVLALLYRGDRFAASVPVLRILVWNVVLIAVTQSLGQVLLAGRREVVTLRIIAVNIVVSFGLGLLLIESLGPLPGAAWATDLAGIVNGIQQYLPVYRLLGGISYTRPARSAARPEGGTDW